MSDDLKTKINTNIINYLTIPMVMMFLAAAAIIVFLSGPIIRSFETNIPLNGLIVGVIVVGCIKIFVNNFSQFSLARIIKGIDEAEQNGKTDEDAIDAIASDLRGHGALLDVPYMIRAVQRMSQTGALILDDHSARLIKSKLGQRVRSEKNTASFLAGILVMLGLIGTFWGLLITIASVGQAMSGVSQNMMVSDPQQSMGAMSEFIDAIARPLEGMGVAFSSSLFGLTGSLYIGVLNFFAGSAQNRFMEAMSKWIDEHIPDSKNLDSEGIKTSGSLIDQDLKLWLSAFVQQATQSNRRMGMVVSALGQLTEGLKRETFAHETLAQGANSLTQAAAQLSLLQSKIESGNGASTKLQSDVQSKMNDLSQISSQISALVRDIDQNNEMLRGLMDKQGAGKST